LSTASDSCACASTSSPILVHVEASRLARDTRRSLSPSRRRSPRSARPRRWVRGWGDAFAGAGPSPGRRVSPFAARAAPGPRPGDPRDALIACASLIVVVPMVARRRRLPAACTATGLRLGADLPKI
jgi:hypothetical protein